MRFILQGLTAQTHTDEINDLYNIAAVQDSLFSVAFVNQRGLMEIEDTLKRHSETLVVFAGIRNNITSYQGLKWLFDLIGKRLFVVDTGSRTLLFHPKFYLVRSKLEAKFMIGSANLTLGGLNNNIEASIAFGLDLTDADDKKFVDDIIGMMESLPKDYPSHVTRIKSVQQLDDLLSSGRIIDENQLPPVTPSTLAPNANADTIPPITLKVKRKKPKLTKSLLAELPKPKAAAKALPAGSAAINLGAEYELVWESKELTRRDLSIPDDKVSHPTGSMNLDKGKLSTEIDHRHYFRDEVFSGLQWTTSKRTRTVEDATATFVLVLKGVSVGEFDLAIHHTTSTDTKMYKQRNAMTRLSWGEAADKVKRPHLIDRTLRLYKNRTNAKKFLIEID